MEYEYPRQIFGMRIKVGIRLSGKGPERVMNLHGLLEVFLISDCAAKLVCFLMINFCAN